ncbi:MAG TPA: long-chain fatty acid--CoA ligase [Terriglobales bacterium]|nr:long-chain fatty acid--CoA ligase [Terriglobales bacterium]
MASRKHWNSPQNPGLNSLNDLLLWAREDGAAPRLGWKANGAWTTMTAAELYRRARALASALAAGGVAPGERVAILSESRPEWLIADFGCLAAGVIDVPIYPTLTAAQISHILGDSGACGVFASSREQVAKLCEIAGDVASLRWVCCFDAAGATTPAPGLREWDWPTLLVAEPTESETHFLERMRATPPERVATLIYTSGTTGAPKGVVLTHANLCANLNVSVLDFDFGERERRLSILPLSHITERHVAYVDLMFGDELYFAESLDQVAANLIELQPTFLVSVPRLFEKVAAGVKAQAAARSRAARAIFAWARRVGAELASYRLRGARPPLRLRFRAAVADRLVWGQLKARLGGRLNKIISGGAPLGRELTEFLLSMDVLVDEGYGLTETSPVVALNRPGARRPGSIGKPLANVEVRFADDGELLVRGPSVFQGYYQMPAATAAALDDAGWFHTGDIGREDAEGFLYITDRKKDLIKTSGGKFIAPQPIEAQLKASLYVAEAVVVGDGRHFAAVLLVPNWNALAQRGLDCGDRDAACGRADVRAVFQAEVDRVNAGLARFETLKKFVLLAGEFTVAAGELTPTIKVRRRAVEARYRPAIDALYAEAKPLEARPG